MRILVTGSSGWLGTALVRGLIGDHGIDAIVHGGALHKPNIETHARLDALARGEVPDYLTTRA